MDITNVDVGSSSSSGDLSYRKILLDLQCNLDNARMSLKSLMDRCSMFLKLVHVFNKPIDSKKDVDDITFLRICRGVIFEMSAVPDGTTYGQMLNHPSKSDQQRERMSRVAEMVRTNFHVDLIGMTKDKVERLIEMKKMLPDYVNLSDVVLLVEELKKGRNYYLDQLKKDVDKIENSLIQAKQVHYEVNMDSTQKMENIHWAATAFAELLSVKPMCVVQDVISAERFEDIQAKLLIMLINVERLDKSWIDDFSLEDVNKLAGHTTIHTTPAADQEPSATRRP